MSVPTYIFDTSAILCLLRNEKGAEQVYQLLKKKNNPFKMHRINLGEIYSVVLKYEGKSKAHQLYGYLIQFPIEFVDHLDDAFLLRVAGFKVDHGLGFADSFVAATAYKYGGIIVTKDNDLRPLAQKGILKVQWI